jgi:hypothetical protein
MHFARVCSEVPLKITLIYDTQSGDNPKAGQEIEVKNQGILKVVVRASIIIALRIVPWFHHRSLACVGYACEGWSRWSCHGSRAY